MLAKLSLAAILAATLVAGAHAGYAGDKYFSHNSTWMNGTTPGFNWTMSWNKTWTDADKEYKLIHAAFVPNITYTMPKMNWTYTHPNYTYTHPNWTYSHPNWTYAHANWTYNETAIKEMYMSKYQEFETSYMSWLNHTMHG